MANLSDAFGTIEVKGVGKEFLEFLNEVQGTDEKAYYKLCEVEDLRQAEVDENNDLTINFSTFGRWHYGNNIEGYLKGTWLQPNEYVPESNKKAYDAFIEAMKIRNGKVEVVYTDSDSAMDWMGRGTFTMSVNKGVVEFTEVFDEERMTLDRYCELYDVSREEAIESIYGDEVATAYLKEVEKSKKAGKEPAEFDEWIETYEEV